MSPLPNVVIVMARCSHSRQSFGIRFEEHERHQWSGDWAFAIKETAARSEGYDRGQITGIFDFDAAYPGCPHCHSAGIVKCGCGKVACWDGESRTIICPWCGSTGELSGSIQSLSAGADR